VWCNSFDADLLAVVPGAVEALGTAGEVKLWTYSRLTDGKINHPSCWNADEGYVAFFWTAPELRPPPSYVTEPPEVTCTFLEAVRDEWVHSCTINVNGQDAWNPPSRLMEQLMYDLRGWTLLGDEQREAIQEWVRHSLRAAAGRLTEVIAAGAQ
jgi:hypothetical protein